MIRKLSCTNHPARFASSEFIITLSTLNIPYYVPSISLRWQAHRRPCFIQKELRLPPLCSTTAGGRRKGSVSATSIYRRNVWLTYGYQGCFFIIELPHCARSFVAAWRYTLYARLIQCKPLLRSAYSPFQLDSSASETPYDLHMLVSDLKRGLILTIC